MSLALSLLPGVVVAQEFGTCERSLAEQYLDINNVRARILNTGGLFYRGEPHVYEVPIHSGSNAIFAGALWIGGMIDGHLRASAARYSSNELWAGPLDDLGHPPTDCKVYDRIYKVSTSDIESYLASGIASDDMRDWPTGLGAPTMDAEGNEIDLMDVPLSARRDRVINLAASELPAVLGDQSIWWVMNDRGNVHNSTDTEPMGIEVHGHAFAAINPFSAISNATLYHYRVFNKNAAPIREAYVGIFLDADIGNANDDYLGSDSLRGMGFVYNADNDDEGDQGYGIAPPALGILFLEGPSADVDLKDNDRDGRADEANERPRTTTIGPQPPLNIFDHPTGELYYNLLRGRWRDGKRFTVGGTGRDDSNTPTNFIYSGDPITGEFWSEMNIDGYGTSNNPGDRRFVISSGPFSIEPLEEADFTFAIVWARGRDHLDSVIELRKAADHVRNAFELGGWDNLIFPFPEDPALPELNQSAALADNFPEPFSERTTIKYRVPDFAFVQLVVLDVLGREVTVLVREPKDAGEYSVPFDGTDLPSGVYFYRIEIGHASATRSMMLVK